MVLMVPDEPEENTQGEVEETEGSSAAQGTAKAELDDTGAKASKKVDLDLEDAPFLEDEEEEEEEIEEVDTGDLPVLEKKKEGPDWLKSKLVLYGGGSVIFLLLAIIVFLLTSSPDETPVGEPPQVEAPPPPPTPEPEPVPEPDEAMLRLDPFWIEQEDAQGDIRFLVARLALSTTDEQLSKNLTQETLKVRNAIYYFLKNKDLQYLSDEKNSEKLKEELLAVINQYMGAGQFDSLMFEQYLVK